MGCILTRLIDVESHGPALQHLTLVGAWRMAAIPPTLIFAEMANRFHLHVTHAKLATAARKGVDASWVIKFENVLVFKSHLVFSNETGMKKWLSMLASPKKKEHPDLCIGPTELATTTRRCVVAPLVMNSRSCWFSKAICFFLMMSESCMKKWPSFQQCWHLPARKSSQISAFGRLSLLQPPERALMPPWS
jgi:hypothetical protein